MDDIRKHDPTPTDEEQSWMVTEAGAAMLRVFVLAVVALALGVSANVLLGHALPTPWVSASAQH